MAVEPHEGARAFRLAAAALASAFLSPPVAAADPPRAYIYQCELNGKRETRDRPIAECAHKDQRQLNPDGSLNRIVPPTMTEDERAEKDRKELQDNVDRVARNDAVRRDRNLMVRFPDEAAHRAGREKALGDVRLALRLSNERIALLNVERKPLLDDAEFYVGKALPSQLKFKLDSNEASLEAQKSLQLNQQDELVRITRLYDAELLRLKKLWAGAPAGSLGPAPSVPAAAQTEALQSTSAPARPASSAQPRTK